MEAEIARLTRLVDDLLLLAQSDRDDFLRPAPVQLDELVTELWDGLSLIAERDFEIGQLEPVTVQADPDRLAQALRNLARNAIAQTQAPDGLVRVDRDSPRTRDRCASPSATTARESRPSCAGACSSASTAPTRPGRGPRAAPGWGSRSCEAIAEAHHGTVRVTESPSRRSRVRAGPAARLGRQVQRSFSLRRPRAPSPAEAAVAPPAHRPR